MSLFCLVHGSTQTVSGWSLLVPELEKRGHQTVCVGLPNDPDASGIQYATVIASALAHSKEAPIVVTHSASGLFLPLVADRRPVSRLVFLAAIIPQIGKSFLEQMRENPDMLWPDWIGKDPAKDHEAAVHFLFHDCSPEIARWAITTLRLTYARRAMAEVFPLEHWPDIPSTYILCQEDRTVRPEWLRKAVRERLGVAAIELPGGHCPHVSRPADLAQVLSGLT
jgi:pimeloyl-ACP methyl ester carboxylesterase